MRTGGKALLIAALAAVIVTVTGLTPSTAAITDPTSTVDGALSDPGQRRITYVGTFADKWDLERLGHGTAGSWFPQFGATSPTVGATQDNVRDRLPAWVAAFNHTANPVDPGCAEPGALERGCLPTYNFRTFSRDAALRSEGGHGHWPFMRLPGGECGGAGAIVDPKTYSPKEGDYPDPTGLVFPPGDEPEPTNNNTINRIQLQDGVPDTFYVGVVTDTTGGDFDSDVVEIRGNAGLIDQPEDVAESQVEPPSAPSATQLAANGTPDVHVFRVDNFVTGDYLKLRLHGIDAPASFGGLLFDVTLPRASGRHTDEPATCQR